MAPLEFPAKKCFSRGKIPPWKTAAPFLLLCLIRIVQKGFLLSISVTISNSDGICQGPLALFFGITAGEARDDSAIRLRRNRTGTPLPAVPAAGKAGSVDIGLKDLF